MYTGKKQRRGVNMKRDYGGVGTAAQRAHAMLNELSHDIECQREENDSKEYYLKYTRNGAAGLPKLTRRIVEQSINDLEANGYKFSKKTVGNVQQYELTIQNVIDIYHHRKFPKYRDLHEGPFVIYISNLKGGATKTVSTVTLAHGLRVHEDLLRYDLRILVIDFDPQASSTMFLNHTHSIGTVIATASQAMLNDIDAAQLKEEFILPTVIPGVDVMPASIDDGFVASQWKELVEESLPGISQYAVLQKTIIDRIGKDYDFIFIDTGPHLDAFMLNALAASDMLFTPIPPAQVDFHSTLKYLTRLPEMFQKLEQDGIEPKVKANIGYMTKISNKKDHESSHSFARQVFTNNMLDATLPRLDGFERTGESFDTIISANPQTYAGSAEAFKKARREADRFIKAVFDRIEFVRSAA